MLGVLDESGRVDQLDHHEPQDHYRPDRKACDERDPQAPGLYPAVLTRR